MTQYVIATACGRGGVWSAYSMDMVFHHAIRAGIKITFIMELSEYEAKERVYESVC